MLKFEAYCFNTGGNGSLTVKYSIDDGKTYKNIPSEYCYSYNATQKQIEEASKTETNIYPAYVDFRNLYINKFYTGNSVRNLASTIECLDDEGNPVKLVDGADLNAIIDGNLTTSCHTAWRGSVAQGTITPYPHNYYITFEQKTSFNNIRFSFNNDAFGEYEIYTSEDGETYTLLTKGINERTGTISFDVPLDKNVETKYIKLVVKSQVQNKAFYNFREMEFLQTLDLGTQYNVYSAADQSLTYDKNWSDVNGLYINGKAMHTEGGNVKFYLNGTNMIVFATNAKSTIKIDGETYVINANDNNRNPSFIIDGLKKGIHLVEIDAKDMNFDMIKTTGTISSASGLNSVALGISISAGVMLIGAIVAVVVVTLVQKKKA